MAGIPFDKNVNSFQKFSQCYLRSWFRNCVKCVMFVAITIAQLYISYTSIHYATINMDSKHDPTSTSTNRWKTEKSASAKKVMNYKNKFKRCSSSSLFKKKDKLYTCFVGITMCIINNKSKKVNH